jgi:hypothetical protein
VLGVEQLDVWLNAVTSSSLEIEFGGVNRPVPLMTTGFMFD